MSGLTTCWTMLSGAADGNRSCASEFDARYRPPISDFFRRRWSRSAALHEIEDATQEVLFECLRQGGAVGRAQEVSARGFRPYLFGVCQNVARRFEERLARRGPVVDALAQPSSMAPAMEETPEVEFDRAWARNIVRLAREAFEAEARASGPPRIRRSEILRLRFFDGVPIRTIAKQWEEDPARLHHEYAKARAEFRTALEGVLRHESPGGTVDLESELSDLMVHLG